MLEFHHDKDSFLEAIGLKGVIIDEKEANLFIKSLVSAEEFESYLKVEDDLKRRKRFFILFSLLEALSTMVNTVDYLQEPNPFLASIHGFMYGLSISTESRSKALEILEHQLTFSEDSSIHCKAIRALITHALASLNIKRIINFIPDPKEVH